MEPALLKCTVRSPNHRKILVSGSYTPGMAGTAWCSVTAVRNCEKVSQVISLKCSLRYCNPAYIQREKGLHPVEADRVFLSRGRLKLKGDGAMFKRQSSVEITVWTIFSRSILDRKGGPSYVLLFGTDCSSVDSSPEQLWNRLVKLKGQQTLLSFRSRAKVFFSTVRVAKYCRPGAQLNVLCGDMPS